MARHTRNRRQTRGKRRRQTRNRRTQRGGLMGFFEDTSSDIQKKIDDLKQKLLDNQTNKNLGTQEIADINNEIIELGSDLQKKKNEASAPTSSIFSWFTSDNKAAPATPGATSVNPGANQGATSVNPGANQGATNNNQVAAGGRRRRRRSYKRK